MEAPQATGKPHSPPAGTRHVAGFGAASRRSVDRRDRCGRFKEPGKPSVAASFRRRSAAKSLEVQLDYRTRPTEGKEVPDIGYLFLTILFIVDGTPSQHGHVSFARLVGNKSTPAEPQGRADFTQKVGGRFRSSLDLRWGKQ